MKKLGGTKFSSLVGWKLSTIAIIFVLLLPIIFVVSTTFSVELKKLVDATSLLPLYVKNTAIILVGVCALTLFLGVSTAWVVSVYDFPLRKHFEWILILPLAIPTFINAIAYVGLSDFAGPIRIFLRWLGTDTYFDIMDHTGAIFVMSLVLYPYVYVASRAAFALQSASLIEVSRSLGQSLTSTFYRVVVPIAWPAIFSGLVLVIMEVLNDYGVVHYFGIPTFTTGIFKSWLTLGDLASAVFFSLVILLFVALLFLIDHFISKGKKIYNENEDRVFTRIKPRRPWVPFVVCLIPIFFGFIIPVAQMSFWAVIASNASTWFSSFSIMINTAVLGLLSAFSIVILAIVISYTARISKKSKLSAAFLKLPMFGYALPGAVIGIGIVAFIVWINPNWIYSGIMALVLGYSTRFFAVGYGSINAGFDKVPIQMDHAASSLGKSAAQRLFLIHLPILKPILIGAFIMVFVDVAKELPLTLILRPFNYETLATNAFQYAKDEMAPKSAASSLLVIFVSAIPVYSLNKLLNK